MKTTYKCKNCGIIHTEIQHPSDEYERDLELCNKCRERTSEKKPKEYCGKLPDFPISAKSTQYPNG